jgi:hypothetical protein
VVVVDQESDDQSLGRLVLRITAFRCFKSTKDDCRFNWTSVIGQTLWIVGVPENNGLIVYSLVQTLIFDLLGTPQDKVQVVDRVNDAVLLIIRGLIETIKIIFPDAPNILYKALAARCWHTGS